MLDCGNWSEGELQINPAAEIIGTRSFKGYKRYHTLKLLSSPRVLPEFGSQAGVQ